MTLPKKVHAPLVSRLKLIASLDIAERRRPQDGRSTYRSKTGEVDLRVSTLPLLHGEKIVMRLLRKGAEQLQLDEVGLSDQQLANVLNHIERPQGLCLLTGPTGAGKTSTLYAFLSHLSDVEHNLITIEDPVEYELPGVNQTQVTPRIGFTFATALKTVLRQDPDVVMVGEIKDLETAELALQASLTGHMVFSTLHTNDAPGAVTRLADLGIPDYLIASSLTMVVAQRLGRRVCSKCIERHIPTEREIERLRLTAEDQEFDGWVNGAGCKSCSGTGYKGRIAFMEILSVDKGVKAALLVKADEDVIRRAARKGGLRSLREDGIVKARQGITTLEEVLRTTPTDLVLEEDFIRAEAALEESEALAATQAEQTPEEYTYSPEVLEYSEPEVEEVAPGFERVDVSELDFIADEDDPRLWQDDLALAARTVGAIQEVRGSQLTVDAPAGIATARDALNRLEQLLEPTNGKTE
ncbi:MAG: ATPase, T2SS/T4P/T4SS family [Euzebya sp.]